MIKKRIAIFFVVVACFIVQNTMLKSIDFGAVSPNLLLIITAGFGFAGGRKEGMYVGFASGLLIDLVYGDVVGMYAVLFVVIGYVVGICNEIYYTDELSVPIILIAISDFMFNFAYYVFNFLLRGRLDVLYYIWRTILPEVVYTVLVAVVLYQLLHTLNYYLELKEDKEVL